MSSQYSELLKGLMATLQQTSDVFLFLGLSNDFVNNPASWHRLFSLQVSDNTSLELAVWNRLNGSSSEHAATEVSMWWQLFIFIITDNFTHCSNKGTDNHLFIHYNGLSSFCLVN